MITRLNSAGIEDPTRYIKFFGLRTHGVLPNGKPATEIVYVHSKMMIVDDKIALIGSANINDRSMMGSRDSELAVVVNDSRETASTIDGEPFMAREFAHSLRTTCWAQIFGLEDPKEAADPLSEALWDLIDSRAQVG